MNSHIILSEIYVISFFVVVVVAFVTILFTVLSFDMTVEG